tara:strand:- start:2490 stop:3260 length:771 start_codon:yes stop_codon:yes gene_type:complete
MNKITLLGSFGAGNFGDDWILENAAKKWKTSNVCSRGFLSSGYRKTSSFFKKTILPGGAVFQDKTSGLSFYWYFLMVLFSKNPEGYDMDLTELKNPFRKLLISFLIKFKFQKFELRPGTSWTGLLSGDDSVFSFVNAEKGDGSVWCPFPGQNFLPEGVDSVFISDRRNYFPNSENLDFFQHQSGKIEESFFFLSKKESIISSRYHPLIFAWMNGKKGLGVGPYGGKIHSLCERAGFPWCEEIGKSCLPEKPRKKWV